MEAEQFEIEVRPGEFQPVLAYVREQFVTLGIDEKSEEQTCVLMPGDFEIEVQNGR